MSGDDWVFGFGSLVEVAALADYLGRGRFAADDFQPCRLLEYRRAWNIARDNADDIPGLDHFVHGATGASRTTREDGTVEVAGTHAHLEDEAAQRHAAVVSRRAESLERQGPPRRPGLARAGAALLLATGTWLALSQWTLYAETPEGREGTWRAMGAAIVVLLAALRLLAPGRSVPAVAAAVVVGLLLVPSGLLLAETARAAASETISGMLTVLVALLTLDRTTPAPSRPRDTSTRS